METMEQKDREYGIPEQKKFPLDSREHVISAVKFFNWAKPRYRKELAKRIAKKVKEYNIQLTPSKNNEFYKYYMPDDVMIHCAIIGNKFLEEYLSSDDILSHHGIPGQKWGVRRYQNYDGSLTPAGRERYGESKQLASQLFEKAKDHEPRITKDVMDSVNGTSAKMYGLEHKLKTEESLTRKIRTDSEEKKITPFDAAYGIKDGVRYTALSPDNDFTSNYYKIKDSLEKKGYSEVRCKNYFDLYRQGQVKHKSVQSVFQSDDGYLFEMQFQTKASQDAKDKKVPIYEERRKPGLSKERQEALERQMVELAENVPDPKDVYKIKTYSSIKHSLGQK